MNLLVLLLFLFFGFGMLRFLAHLFVGIVKLWLGFIVLCIILALFLTVGSPTPSNPVPPDHATPTAEPYQQQPVPTTVTLASTDKSPQTPKNDAYADKPLHLTPLSSIGLIALGIGLIYFLWVGPLKNYKPSPVADDQPSQAETTYPTASDPLSHPLNPLPEVPSRRDTPVTTPPVTQPPNPPSDQLIQLSSHDYLQMTQQLGQHDWLQINVPPQFFPAFLAQAEWLYSRTGTYPDPTAQEDILKDVSHGFVWH